MDKSLKETEWWWIDYLENELDIVLEKDLELLLQHSQEDRDSFENFRLLKEWIRESDPVMDWPIEERAKKVRAHVMAAIEDISMETKDSSSQRGEEMKSLSF